MNQSTLHTHSMQPLAIASDTPATRFATVLYDFAAQSQQELSVRHADVVRVIEEAGPWTCVANMRGEV